MADPARAARGVSTPRRPQASPLFRLVSDHLHRLQTVSDERFTREYGPWRPVVAQVADKFLACGVLDHGFARIRCDACAHEYLLAFLCKCRYFCPSCHAKRLAICEVDPLACPPRHGTMRVVTCITQASVIDQILTPLWTRATRAARESHAGPRSPPSTWAPASRGASHVTRAPADAPPAP